MMDNFSPIATQRINVKESFSSRTESALISLQSLMEFLKRENTYGQQHVIVVTQSNAVE